jgi:hypothetical protein
MKEKTEMRKFISILLVVALALAGSLVIPVPAQATYNNESIIVTPTSGLITTESGGQATFTIKLSSSPNSDVVVGLSSSDTTEGTVSPSSFTLNSGNWNSSNTVTVTGVDDAEVDGNISYSIITAAATSGDIKYNGLNASDVSVTNQDNDPAVKVNPASGLVTTEPGGTATFTLVLNTRPTDNVTIGLSSSDTSEGTVSPSSVTFTSANWNTPLTVTATGVDDQVVDGNILYTLITAAATSTDVNYNGLNGDDVGVTNYDNDETPISPVTGIASFVPDNPDLLLSNLTASDPAALPPAGKPDLDFPQGFYAFNLTLKNVDTVVMTITFPENIPAGSQYWKYSEKTGWFDATSLVGSNDGDNVLTLTLTDGAPGDLDGQKNGTIVDPGGPAYNEDSPNPVGVGGEVNGVNPVRVLAPWLTAGLVICLGAALLMIRRRKTN